MINIILNGFLPMKNKLNFIKSSNLFTFLCQPITCILLLLSLNSFAQPPIDITKEKAKQPPITQPPRQAKEPKSQLIPAKTNPAPVKTDVVTQPPRQTLSQGIKEITIFPFEDNTKIKFQYKGSAEIEDLGDTAIVGMQLQPNTKYKLWVTTEQYVHPVYNINAERFILYKQIEPYIRDVIPDSPPQNNNSKSKLPYNYTLPDGSLYPSYYDILLTDIWIEDNNGIKVKKPDEETFRIFYNNIYGFTFIEGHKYILEAEQIDNDYRLIKIISDKDINVKDPKIKVYPSTPPNLLNSMKANGNKIIKETAEDVTIPINPIAEINSTIYQINSLDSGYWYLRYLYEADGVTPITFTEKDELQFRIIFDKFFNKASGSTPCSTFEAKLLTNDSDKFDCFNLIAPDRKCEITKLQQLFFNQLQTVNSYLIIDNKLQLSKDSKILLWFEGRKKRQY